MLIRVRSNVGTWKLQVEGSQTIFDLVQDPKFSSWKVTQQLSLDPSGKTPLVHDQSLDEQGIKHGTMIYCRVGQRNHENSNDNNSNETKESSPSSSQAKKKINEVIDLAESTKEVIELIDSDDCVDDNNNDNDKDNDGSSVSLLGSSSDEEEQDKKPKATDKKRLVKSSDGDDSSPRASRKKTKTIALIPETASSVASVISSSPRRFQIASYNVWFGPPDPTVNAVYPEHRMKAIAEALQGCGKDLLVIGFQELTTSLRSHLLPHLHAMGYKLCTQPLEDFYGVGLAISNKLDIVEAKFIPYPNSSQRRGLLYVQTSTFLFGTTHLESFVDRQLYDGVKQREMQILEAAEFFQQRMQSIPSIQIAIIAGDLNWDDERISRGVRTPSPNKLLVPLLSKKDSKNWKDAGNAFDYTYDCKENPMLGGNLRRRFDRCIYLCNDKNNYSASLRKLGKCAIPNLTWNKKNPYNGTSRTVPVAPSDHFGIAVTFEEQNPK